MKVDSLCSLGGLYHVPLVGDNQKVPTSSGNSSDSDHPNKKKKKKLIIEKASNFSFTSCLFK